jgi:hypothetical protein
MAFEQLMAEAQIKKEKTEKKKEKKPDPAAAAASSSAKKKPEEEYGNTSFNESWSREKPAPATGSQPKPPGA